MLESKRRKKEGNDIYKTARLSEDLMKHLTVELRKQNNERAANVSSHVAAVGAVEYRRLHSRLQRDAAKQAEQEQICEYMRNAHSAARARDEFESRASALRSSSARSLAESARLARQLGRQSELDAEANLIDSTRRASEIVAARKATEYAARLRAMNASRIELIELSKERKRREAEESEMLRVESTIRSYGGFMVAP
jgi:hypothetical protein